MLKQICYVYAAAFGIAFFTLPAASAAESCARFLAPAQLRSELNADERRTGFDFSTLTTEPSLETFYAGGLPRLARLARDNATTIARVIEDQFAVFHLGIESDDTLDAAQIRDNLEFLSDLNAAFRDLEDILADGRPTEANAGQLARAEIFLRMVSFGLAMSQLDQCVGQILNPFGNFDAEHVEALMLAIEDGAFDNILNSFAAPPSPPPPVADTAAAPELTRLPVPVETDLARALSLNLTLNPSVTYSARTSREVAYGVRVSKPVVKQLSGRQRQAVQRLMRAIFTGRGSNSGIKTLFDIGPDIIEVKTVMHSQLRIIGCLSGRELRLLRVIDIKDSVATYARRIPANLCR